MRRIQFDPMQMAERIVEKRIECNYTQNMVAEKLNIARDSISRYENGSRSIPINILVEMSNLFDVSVEYLVTGEYPSDDTKLDDAMLEMIMKYTPTQKKVICKMLKTVDEAFKVGAQI